MQVQTREDPGSNGRGWTALRERRAGTANLRVGTRDPRRQARPFLPSTRGAKMPALRKSHHSAENRGNTWERHRSGTCARAPQSEEPQTGRLKLQSCGPRALQLEVCGQGVSRAGSFKRLGGRSILGFAPLCWLFLVFAANLPHFLVCSSIHQTSAFIFTWHSVCVPKFLLSVAEASILQPPDAKN